ncbi:peptide-methionine (R)-S-oxide reductase MsrB [Candidatus Woesearchaeota archaeon]|nr:peptide-methionine (R)-S-oxide reductase MsrB [Candidatus Woesearchaeota archaeon]
MVKDFHHFKGGGLSGLKKLKRKAAEENKKITADWKKKLTPEQYRVLREKGTEDAFSGKYDDFFESGQYKCAACGEILFDSKTKYDSGCGWPAFFEANKDSIVTKEDNSCGMKRIEVMCRKCGGHLGHVFDDGPKPTGKRYCINSAALEFWKG